MNTRYHACEFIFFAELRWKSPKGSQGIRKRSQRDAMTVCVLFLLDSSGKQVPKERTNPEKILLLSLTI